MFIQDLFKIYARFIQDLFNIHSKYGKYASRASRASRASCELRVASCELLVTLRARVDIQVANNFALRSHIKFKFGTIVC